MNSSDAGGRGDLAWISWGLGIVALWLARHLPTFELAALWPAGIETALSRPLTGTPPLVLAGIAATLATAWSLAGRQLLRRAGPQFADAVEEAAFSIGVGLGVGASLIACLGLLGALTPRAIALVCLAWAAVGFVPSRRAGLARRAVSTVAGGGATTTGPAASTDVLKPISIAAADRVPLALAGLAAGASGLAALVHAVVPPWQPDALYYQLTLPRLYLQHGGFVALAQEPVVSGYPGLGQMLFALGIAAGRDDLAALGSFAHGPLLVLATFVLVRHAAWRDASTHGETTDVPATSDARTAALHAAVVVAAVPQLAIVCSSPLVDAITAAQLTLATLATVRAWESGTGGRRTGDVSTSAAPEPQHTTPHAPQQDTPPESQRSIPNDVDSEWLRWTGLAALCLGFALANKYLALPAVGLLGTALLAGAARQHPPAAALPRMARAFALAVCLIVLPCLPWMIKNARDWGTPLFPLHCPASVGERVSTVVREHQAEFVRNGNAVPFFLLPVELTFGSDPNDIGRFQGEVGPLLLALVALPVVAGRPRGAALALAAYALALFAVWAAASRQMRFLLPAIPVMLAAVMARRRWPRALGWCIAAGAWGCAGWTIHTLRPGNDLPYALGRESRESYYRSLSATASLFEAYAQLEHEPPGKVAFFWEYRGYLCPREFLPEHAFRLQDWPRDPAALLARLHGLGVSHVLINRSIWDEERAGGTPWPFGAALEGLTRLPGVTAVHLRESPPPVLELWRLR